MRVRDLRLLLSMLPDDMVVQIDGGSGCYHVTAVEKRQRRTIPGVPLADPPIPDRVAEPALVLGQVNRYLGSLWFEPEPPFKLSGRWPRPRMSPVDEAAVRRLLNAEEEPR